MRGTLPTAPELAPEHKAAYDAVYQRSLTRRACNGRRPCKAGAAPRRAARKARR